MQRSADRLGAVSVIRNTPGFIPDPPPKGRNCLFPVAHGLDLDLNTGAGGFLRSCLGPDSPKKSHVKLAPR